MRYYYVLMFLCGFFHSTLQEEVRLLDLEPPDAQQIIEQQDTSLKYAPKIESNVPAVRYIGNEPQNVAEDIYLANQYHGQDGLGGYLYGYSVPDIAKTEKKQAGGNLKGAYNYIAGNGQEIKVEYWDDGTGFHQIDNVPKNLPEDLPEVKKAKEEFMRIWLQEAERNSHPVEDPYNSEGQYKEGPLSPQGQAFRQQQFTSQFGQNPNAGFQKTEFQNQQHQGVYQSAASHQQNTIYQSNLEKNPQIYNPNYQPYEGKDQQNQGAYQSKQYSSSSKSSQNQGNYGQTSSSRAPGFPTGGGIQNQRSVNYQQNQQPNQNQWNQPSPQQDSTTYNQKSVNYQQPNQNQWNQPSPHKDSGYQTNQGYQTQYQQQSTSNVNQYAPQPSQGQTTSYGHHGQSKDQDDGEYHENDEEQQGPPKGFFYKFDYPVGIIVSKQGPAQGGSGGSSYGNQQSGGGYRQQQSGGYGQQQGGTYQQQTKTY